MIRSFSRIPLPLDSFRDKVLGCWLGKNAGGTLGEPLEAKFGRKEMFQVEWYTSLPEGGIPNDDLEMQLIWLQALQDKGPGLNSRDLTEYWLNCIAYNFDEYGLCKSNMKKGFIPPVSGWHNNYFRDFMGSPIRSEIWACVAPGSPEIAAHYAVMDAICDHGGGESVYGEIFNAVIESLAFVNSNINELLEAGLQAIPESCAIYRAVNRVIQMHSAGIDWIQARDIVMNEFFHPVSQFAPINIGFQTIGLLYGTDFGDSICKAVNCGWDTDCTAATIGAMLGIINGASGLPEKWIAPLGDEISTNMKTGGIRHLHAPTNIYDLTEVVCKQAEIVLNYWFDDKRLPIGKKAVIPPGNGISYDLTTIKLDVVYKDNAAIVADKQTCIELIITNPHPESLRIKHGIELPANWKLINPEQSTFLIPPLDTYSMSVNVLADDKDIEDVNCVELKLHAFDRPAIASVPIILAGGYHWMHSHVYVNCEIDDSTDVEEQLMFKSEPKGWIGFWRPDNNIDIEDIFSDQSGIIYLLHYIFAKKDQEVVIGVPNNNVMKIWQNGEFLHMTSKRVPLRPSLGNGGAKGDNSNYVRTILKEGWNQFLIKLERGKQPIDAYFVIGGLHPHIEKNHGEPIIGLKRSVFPWR